MIDDEEDPFRPDMEMSAFQRNSKVGTLQVKEVAMTKCKKIAKVNKSTDGLKFTEQSTLFRVYADMLGICENVRANKSAKLIDVVKMFIIQVNNDTLNKIDISNVNKKTSIEALLTVCPHNSDYKNKCLLNYEDSSTYLDLQTYVKNIKSRELDVSYKMYGDAHYSLNGNFTTLSPQISTHKKSEFSRQSTTSDSREETDTGREEMMSNMSRASLLCHYTVWVIENSGLKKERVLGIDRYGLYVYKQMWEHMGNKSILEGGDKLIICMSCILAIKPCKMSNSKFMIYYLNKRTMKECRIFVETPTNKAANEIVIKIKTVLGSISFNY